MKPIGLFLTLNLISLTAFPSDWKLDVDSDELEFGLALKRVTDTKKLREKSLFLVLPKMRFRLLCLPKRVENGFIAAPTHM